MGGSKDSLHVFLAGALRLWIAITALFCVSTLILYARVGSQGLSLLIQEGPFSITDQTLTCVAIAWLSWGIAVVLLQNPRFRSEHGTALVCSLVILLLYVNILRERTLYGDVGDYVRGALDLQAGRPFHNRYIYPPFLATLCQPFLRLGESAVRGAFWLANLVSLVAFFWLLKATLVRYGFGRRLALWLVVAFMVVNVPIIRTLGYVQINLHIVNLIMLTMLLFGRHRIASALALAVAVHLKASPVILAVPFLLARDNRWIASFVAGLMGIAGLTYGFYGWAPFAASLHNSVNMYSASGICFRENSVDSLIRGTTALLGTETSGSVLLFKVPLLALILATAVCNVRHATFAQRRDLEQDIFNGIPAFLVLMVLASPLVWEHHPVLLAIPYLVMTKKLGTPNSWMWFLFAYLLEFVMPTFDFFPWSYGRLVSPIVLTILMLRSCRQCDAAIFQGAREGLESFSWGNRCRF